jgi:hypothetical protein
MSVSTRRVKLHAHASLISLIVLDRSCLTPTAAPQGSAALEWLKAASSKAFFL